MEEAFIKTITDALNAGLKVEVLMTFPLAEGEPYVRAMAITGIAKSDVEGYYEVNFVGYGLAGVRVGTKFFIVAP